MSHEKNLRKVFLKNRIMTNMTYYHELFFMTKEQEINK